MLYTGFLMPDTNQTQRRGNFVLWIGVMITVLGLLSNFFYFLNMPQAIIPWINLLLPLIGVIVLFLGVKRAFGQSHIYRGKVWGSIATVLALGLLGLSVYGFVHARELPKSAGAPKVGQKVPDFTLADSSGRSVSLSELLSTQMENSSRPKTVLLVFYRGYW